MGLLWKISVSEQAKTDDKFKEVIQKELDTSHIEGYGRGLLYTHFCS
jgi:hypothetical protein